MSTTDTIRKKMFENVVALYCLSGFFYWKKNLRNFFLLPDNNAHAQIQLYTNVQFWI